MKSGKNTKRKEGIKLSESFRGNKEKLLYLNKQEFGKALF